MKYFHIIKIVFIISFAFLHTAYANNCQEMIGVYRVVPFSDPVGLTTISWELISHAPIGKPIFKVENKNDQTQHISLIHRNIYPITLKAANKNTITNADILFDNHVSSCSYDFGQNNSIIQVDLTKLSQRQLALARTHIIQTWFSRLPAPLEDHNKLIQNHYNIQYYTLDVQSLRKIQYFFIRKYSKIDGIKGLIYIIPLQKITDQAKLTPLPSPLIHP